MKKEGKKIKLAVIISVVSVIIALISLGFSVFISIKELEYKQYSKEMQAISQELQKRGLEFDSTYKKIGLAEKSIMEMMDNCKDELNEEELNKNLKLLINSRNALIKNDVLAAEYYLKQINDEKICSQFSGKLKDTLYIEVGIISFIWITLIICYFIIKRRT